MQFGASWSVLVRETVSSQFFTIIDRIPRRTIVQVFQNSLFEFPFESCDNRWHSRLFHENSASQAYLDNDNFQGFLNMDLDTKKGDSNDNLCNSTQSSDHLSNFVNNEETTEKMSTSNESLQIKDEEKSVSDTAANGEKIDFKVIYNKQKINVEFPLDNTVAKLKKHLENIISVPEAMQKIMFKGLAKDDQTLRDLGVTKGAKVMIVGSKLDDILSVRYVSQPTKQEAEEAASTTSKEPLSKQKVHRKVLDKGMPEDVMPGILNSKDPLPDCPLAGMLNKSGGKVRLTFKLEQDQVWIGSKERTDKITMNSIKSVYSEPIHDHPEYHVMAIQLGTTEASRYWIYWVPAQYVSAIKEAVLGKWCYF